MSVVCPRHAAGLHFHSARRAAGPADSHTKYGAFYPICYAEEEDTNQFGPGSDPDAEEFFDPVLAAQADLGVASEAELCALKSQAPEKFCRECTRAPVSTTLAPVSAAKLTQPNVYAGLGHVAENLHDGRGSWYLLCVQTGVHRSVHAGRSAQSHYPRKCRYPQL